MSGLIRIGLLSWMKILFDIGLKMENTTYFWAKTNQEEKPGISVYNHMLNVGCVARCIAEISPKLLERFQLRSSTIGALAALHDLGKISPGFQRKCKVWLEENGLTKIARNGCWDTAMESDHGKVSHTAIQAFLLEIGIDRDTTKFVSAILGAHHGRLTSPNDRGYRPRKLISDSASQIDWNAERMANARMTWNHFVEDNTPFTLSDDSPALWWLAGLTSIADWIGSDERFFSPERRSDEEISSLVKEALDTIGFQKMEFVRNLSFHDLFHDAEKPEIRWIPNEMQEKTLAIVNGPGVYVVEALMGMGKTEAALWAAYQLLVSGKATGIYFALPTQATSNRMHLRMDEFVRRMCRTSNASRLIHSNSWLTAQTDELLPVATSRDFARDDARIGRDWFNSAKRALIAPFGVGTIDQALLGVVAAKHFFVRHFALAGKVVILDEIHSYDLYTGTLIDKLITTLEALGCTVIVLSATLTEKRRTQMISQPENIKREEVDHPYPLITGRNEGHTIEPVAVTPPESRTVKVDFIAAETAAKEAIRIARKGGAVLWICDTVDAAQKQYQRFIGLIQDEFSIGLLHSRFPYWRREELENEWLERFGKNGINRGRSILISTQIAEQSVDLDADVLITELAPTDMLLQRLGRLWRHAHRQRPVDTVRTYIIKEQKSIEEFRSMEPKAIVEAFGGKAHVYDPFVLLRTLQLWQSHPEVIIPDQIRELLEATYCEQDDDPQSWKKLFEDRFVRNSNERFKAAMNSNYWQPQLPDEEGVQTRLNETPTVLVVLCRSINKQEAVFMDDTSEKLGEEEFRLSTAQAIHRNLVRVPRYCFDHVESCPAFTYKKKNNLKSRNRPDHVEHYIHGEQSVGIVAESGVVKVKGLENGTWLFYSDKLGLVIEKSS